MPSTSSTTSPATREIHVVDFAAADVGRRLRAFEAHIDAALEAGGELQAAMVRARKSHNLSAVVGQPVFVAMTQAATSLAEARGQAVKSHRLLEPIARALGIDASAYGEERKDDGDGIVTGG